MKHLRAKHLIVAVSLAALLLSGCAGQSVQQGLAVSGQTLVGVGTQFVNVSSVYSQHCKAPAVPADASAQQFCDAFAAFGPKFQRAYPLAVSAWKSAVAAGDTATAKGAEATILLLATDLSTLALQAAVAFGGK